MNFWAAFWCYSNLLFISFGRLVFAATNAAGGISRAKVSANSYTVPTIVRRALVVTTEAGAGGTAQELPVQASCTEYALRPGALPSGDGYLWEYYHFMIDFAPAMYHHIHKDNAPCKILYVPGWLRHFSEKVNHLQLTSPSEPWRSMQEKFDFFLGKPLGLTMKLAPDAEILSSGIAEGHRTLLHWNCHGKKEYGNGQWADQPAEYFTEFRDFARALGGITPVKRDVIAVERKKLENALDGSRVITGAAYDIKTGYDRRHLDTTFYDKLVNNSAANGLNTSVIDLETKTVAEQIALFKDVRVIIAQHGAALSNIIFAHEDTLVIEIGKRTFPCYATLAEKLGLHYLHHESTEYSEDMMHEAKDYVHEANFFSQAPEDILSVILHFVRSRSGGVECPKGSACSGIKFFDRKLATELAAK